MFILPAVFFSGFIFPRETMPWIFYAIGALLPATYYIELMRAIVLRGASLADFWLNIVVLAGMGWRCSACARCGSNRKLRDPTGQSCAKASAGQTLARFSDGFTISRQRWTAAALAPLSNGQRE